LYETLSERRRPRQQGGRGATTGARPGPGAAAGATRSTRHFFDDEPDLFHPQMGSGQSKSDKLL
jgi:hypothetical protein